MAQIPQYFAPEANFPSPAAIPDPTAGNAMGKLSQIALSETSDIAKKDAAVRGAEDQARAGTNPVAEDKGLFGFIPTDYSETYNKAAKIAFVEAKKSQLENTTLSLQQKYGNDLDQFQTQLSSFRQDFMANVPLKSQPQFDLLFQDHSTRATRAVMDNKLKQDFQQSQGTILSRFDELTNQLTNSIAADPYAQSDLTHKSASDISHLLEGATRPTTDPKTGQTYPAVLDAQTAERMHQHIIENVSRSSAKSLYDSLPSIEAKRQFVEEILPKGGYHLPVLAGLNDSGKAQVPAVLAQQIAAELRPKFLQEQGKSDVQTAISGVAPVAGMTPTGQTRAGYVPASYAEGSTPWVTDKTDGNGKSVSGYVGDVMQRVHSGMSVEDAIFRQEYAGKGTSATSVDGAVGNSQIMPGTWKQYAKPGEDINNPADNRAVGKRIIADLSNKFGGDPAKIATAYFSGPGNVSSAPTATATPAPIAIPTSSTVAFSHNNPGNTLFTDQPNATKGDPAPGGGFYAHFNTPEDGLAALNKEVTLNIDSGGTLGSFLKNHPGTDANYISAVTSQLGVGAETPLNAIPVAQLVSVVAKQDTGSLVGGAGTQRNAMKLTQAQTLAAIDQMFPGDPARTARARAEANEQFSIVNMALQAQAADEARQSAAEVKERAAKSAAAESHVLASIYDDDPKTTITAKQITDENGPYKDLTPAAKISMIAALHASGRGDPLSKISQQTAADLLGQMRTGNGLPDNKAIYDAFIANKLTRGDFEFLNKQFDAAKTPEGEKLQQQVKDFIKGIEPSIDKSNPLMGKLDTSGRQQMYLLQWNLAQNMDKARKNGEDPRQFIDPSSGSYMGTKEALQPYQKPIDASIKDIADKMRSDKNWKPPAAQTSGATPPPATAPTTTPPATTGANPPVPGAVQTPDGHWWVKDPKTGKGKRVD